MEGLSTPILAGVVILGAIGIFAAGAEVDQHLQLVAAILTSAIVIIGSGTALFMNRDKVPEGLAAIPASFIAFLSNVMPFAILVYGFAGDLINQTFRLSIPSFFALAGIIITGITTQIMAKRNNKDLSGQENTGQLWCTIPGLESVESPYIPTAFISTTTIGMYYIFWAMYSGKPFGYMALKFAAVLMVQFSVFVLGECNASYFPIFGEGTPVMFNILGSVFIGIILSMIAFTASLNGGMEYNPLIEAGSTVRRPRGPGHTQQVRQGDENTFYAELYKDGQLVTDSLSN